MPGHHVTDHQMRLFMQHRQTDTVAVAAAKASMSKATGHRIAKDPRLPSMRAAPRGRRRPEDVSAHWLRHAHASHSLDRGAPIHLVQATLGHASVATTGRYLHARPTDSSARYLGV